MPGRKDSPKGRYTETRLEWRNWQTHGTQNPAPFTGHESSTLSSSTIRSTAYGEPPPFRFDARRPFVTACHCRRFCPGLNVSTESVSSDV